MLEEEVRLQIHVIIFSDNNLQDLQDTLNSLTDSNFIINKIIIITKKRILPKEINLEFGGRWRIQNLTKNITKDQAIHMVQRTARTNCYSFAEAGYKFDPQFFDTINDFVTKKLGQFAMIKPNPDDYNGCTIPNSVHDYWNFNKGPSTVVKSIENYQCQNPNQKIVWTLNDIMQYQMQTL